MTKGIIRVEVAQLFGQADGRFAVGGFADDVVLPSHLGREVANALPNGRFLEIPDTGHLGFIEKPEVVNTAILNFFADTL